MDEMGENILSKIKILFGKLLTLSQVKVFYNFSDDFLFYLVKEEGAKIFKISTKSNYSTFKPKITRI